jgi:hypothetical protein
LVGHFSACRRWFLLLESVAKVVQLWCGYTADEWQWLEMKVHFEKERWHAAC